jgi:hypothetical protein
LLRRFLAPACVALLLASPAGGAEEPARFRECAFGWIPWTKTIEEAKATAKKEGRLVLAIAFPWDGKEHEDGYEGAEAVRSQAKVPPEQAAARRSSDPGWLKEQGALAAWLGEPAVSALVARSFVPVRLRLNTWHFFDGGPGPFRDPLIRLGTSDRATRPPAVVIATPEGNLVTRVQRLGVFDPHWLHRFLLKALREHPKRRPPRPRGDGADPATIAALAAGGDLDEARRRLARVPGSEVETLRLDAMDGDLAAVEKSLLALPAAPERDALLAEVLLRRGKPAEVVAIAGLEAHPAGRVARAAALERLGRDDEALPLWRQTLAEAPDSPRAARAALRLSPDAPRAREWDAGAEPAFDPAADTTVCGKGGPAAAVRYLLSQQDPDGAWRDPRGGGAGITVPRTALATCALRAHRTISEKPLDDAIARGTRFVGAWCDAPGDEVWSLTYALHLQLELLETEKSADARRRALALLERLGRIEHDGGWTYTAPARLHTFNTAPILLLLVRARDAGLPVDADRIERTAKFLERNRVGKSGVFHYGTTMENMSGEKGKTDAKSTCMRSAVCETALVAAGRKSPAGIEGAVDLFLANEAAGRATQKIFENYVDATSLQDSYRYFFGLWYAAQAATRLPDAKRKKACARLSSVLFAAQEIDGSFVDSQSVGKASSTALALLAAAELR